VILLDTNHVSILRMPSSERRTRFVERMNPSQDQHFGIPIVAVEETKVPGLRFENWLE
jgi:hypothetical protein